MAAGQRLFVKITRDSLPQVKDKYPFLYLKRGRLEIDDSSIKWLDAAKYPNHKAEQNCANCKLVQGADADAWRPCSIFPGKSVNAKGWCAAYAAKA